MFISDYRFLPDFEDKVDFYNGITFFILVFDITNKESYNYIEHWTYKIWDWLPNVYYTVYIVGNKSDMENMREVTYTEAERMAHRYNFKYFEVSATKN